MGAWGAGSFENDDALDFLGDFEDRPSIARIEEALLAATGDDEKYLEAYECCVAIAAAELVAAAKGNPLEGYQFEAETTAFLNGKVNAADLTRVAAKAIAALDRIARDSELKELWDDPDVEEDARAQWNRSIGDLQVRLSAV